MSVTLVSHPEEISFSADFINAKFQCDDHLQSVGVKSVNTILISSLYDPSYYILQYGSTTVIMTATSNPDSSGNEFPYVDVATAAPAAVQAALPYFQQHPILSADFNITATADNKIILTGKKDGREYDITGYNTTSGALPKLKENYSVFVKLMIQNATAPGFSEAYSAHLTLTNGNEALAILGDKLHQRLTADLHKYGPEIPNENAINCTVSCRKFFFQYAESYGQPVFTSRPYTSPMYTVVHGGLSYRAKGRETALSLLRPGAINLDRFLVQGPSETTTRSDQPQYLYFLNTRTLVNMTVNCKFHFIDGTFASITLGTQSLASGMKVGFNVQFDKIFNPEDFPGRKVRKYEVYLSGANGSAISETRSYVLDYSYKEFYRYFLCWNSWGALESRLFFGKGSVEFDLVQSVAERNTTAAGAISQGNALVYNSSIQTKFTITTGFIANKNLLFLNRDFFVSVFRYVLSDGKLLPITVTSKTIAEIEDGNNLFAQKFEYKFLFEDEAYTEGDIYQPAPPPVRITGQIYFGPSVKRPVTEMDVLNLPNSTTEGSYLISVVTGPNKFINVAYPKITKKWGSAFDNTSQENITSEYLPVDIVIDGILYVLRTMELAIAYRESHDHILTITNV